MPVEQVRDAQLRAGSAAGMSGVWVVDALGLPMHRDGLHLLTNGQVQLAVEVKMCEVSKGAAEGKALVLEPLLLTFHEVSRYPTRQDTSLLSTLPVLLYAVVTVSVSDSTEL